VAEGAVCWADSRFRVSVSGSVSRRTPSWTASWSASRTPSGICQRCTALWVRC